MDNYPFDIQDCNGTIEPIKNEKFFVKLIPTSISYDGPTDLMKYVLREKVSLSSRENVKILMILIFSIFMCIVYKSIFIPKFFLRLMVK